MRLIILEASFACLVVAATDQFLLQEGIDIGNTGAIAETMGLGVGNTGATAETMGVDTHGRRRRRRRRRRRQSPARVFCSNDINGGDQVCSNGCWSAGSGCTGSCSYYSVNGDNTSAIYCGCSCTQADPATVNVVDPVTAAPSGMVLNDNPSWTPAFCISKSSKNLPIPGFLLEKMPKLEDLTVAFMVCWGVSYGTAIGLSGSIPGWSIFGNIHWAKSIFGFKPMPKPDGCMFCSDNRPGGKIMICRDLTLGNFSIKTLPLPGQFVDLVVEIGGKFCMGFGIESDAVDSSRTNLYLAPMGGLTAKFTYLGQEVVGDALFTGKITIKNMHWSPLGKNDGISFQLGFWVALYWNDKKFAEVTIELTEEWAIYVTGLTNINKDTPVLNQAAAAVVNPRKSILDRVIPQEFQDVWR